MEYIKLLIPYSEYVESYKAFKKQLESLNSETSTPEAYIEEVDKINKSVLEFLKSSFSDTVFHDLYKGAIYSRMSNVGNPPDAFTRTKETVKVKIKEIQEQLELIENSDMIKSFSEDIFQKRQRFTIKQKRNFILSKLYKLNSNSYHSLNLIYNGNGLKEQIGFEMLDLANDLYKNKYVDFRNSDEILLKIKLDGIEYAQDLEEEDFGLSFSDDELKESEKLNLQKIMKDLHKESLEEIRKEFSHQNDLMRIYIEELYLIMDESLEVINSKLSKKNIRQLLLGKMKEAAMKKGTDKVFGTLWDKFQEKLAENPELVNSLKENVSGLLNP